MRIIRVYENVLVSRLSGKLLRRRWLIAAAILIIALVLEILEHPHIFEGKISFGFVSEVLLFVVAVPLLLGTWLSLYDVHSRLSQAISQLNLKQLIRQQLDQVRDWDELAMMLLMVPRTFLPISNGALLIRNPDTGKFDLKSRWSAEKTSLPMDLLSMMNPKDLDLSLAADNVSGGCIHVQKTVENTSTYFIRLEHEGQCLGWIQFYLEPGTSLRPDQIQLLENIAPDMSLAIENFSLRQTNETQSRVMVIERKRLARYLHDTLAHNLAYIRLKLDQYLFDNSFPVSEITYRELEQMRDVADQSYEQVRSFLAGLTEKTTRDLMTEVQKYAEDMAKRAHFEFQFSSLGQEKPLSPYLIHESLMVIREALTNVETHAGAKNVKLELNWQEDTLQIQVCDDGQGFDPDQMEKKDNHFGLQLMREIIEELNGELNISSQPSSGTIIRFSLPYNHR